MTYIIPYDSAAGKAMADYFDRCESANNATAQLISQIGSLHPELGFPSLSDEQIQQIGYVTDESCDAGGMMAIEVPSSIADQIGINTDLWVRIAPTSGAVVGSEASDAPVYFCPRLTIAEHTWMRYKSACILYKEHAQDPTYRFEVDTNITSRQFRQPKLHQYIEVKHGILPENRRALEHDGKGPITDRTRVALVTRFALRHDYDQHEQSGSSAEAYQTIDDTESVMLRGRALYELIEALPTVRANELLQVLKLVIPSDAQRGFRPSVEYNSDDDRQCFTVTTNLVSLNPDLQAALS